LKNTFRTEYGKIEDPDLKRFVDVLKLNNYSIPLMIRYMLTLKKVMQVTGKPLKDATKQDIERVVSELIKMKPNTRDTELKQIKVFYRWLRTGSLERGQPYPPEVA